jgi:hypothetical protein
MKAACVFIDVGTESLSIVYMNYGLKSLNTYSIE